MIDAIIDSAVVIAEAFGGSIVAYTGTIILFLAPFAMIVAAAAEAAAEGIGH